MAEGTHSHWEDTGSHTIPEVSVLGVKQLHGEQPSGLVDVRFVKPSKHELQVLPCTFGLQSHSPLITSQVSFPPTVPAVLQPQGTQLADTL